VAIICDGFYFGCVHILFDLSSQPSSKAFYLRFLLALQLSCKAMKTDFHYPNERITRSDRENVYFRRCRVSHKTTSDSALIWKRGS
jgi:hypothetical protein